MRLNRDALIEASMILGAFELKHGKLSPNVAADRLATAYEAIMDNGGTADADLITRLLNEPQPTARA